MSKAGARDVSMTRLDSTRLTMPRRSEGARHPGHVWRSPAAAAASQFGRRVVPEENQSKN